MPGQTPISTGSARKRSEHRGPRVEARDREPAQQLPEQVLAADDVEQHRDAHREDAQTRRRAGRCRCRGRTPRAARAPIASGSSRRKSGTVERQARPDALAEAPRDRHVVGVAAAEVEGEHAAEVVGEQRVGRAPRGSRSAAGRSRGCASTARWPRAAPSRRSPCRAMSSGVGHQEEEHEEEEQHAEHRDGRRSARRRTR